MKGSDKTNNPYNPDDVTVPSWKNLYHGQGDVSSLRKMAKCQVTQTCRHEQKTG